jgi:hypothetical protein
MATPLLSLTVPETLTTWAKEFTETIIRKKQKRERQHCLNVAGKEGVEFLFI